jgi:hypothetical protein
MTDGSLKELAKLEKLTARSSSKGKLTFIDETLRSLIQSLHEAKASIETDGVSEDAVVQLAQTIDAQKKEVEDRQKEVYSSLSRLGKSLDKVFN